MSESQTANFHFPKARIIRGQLVDMDGSKIMWNSDNTMGVSLHPVESGSQFYSYNAAVDKDGNWSFSADESITGSYYLEFYIYSDTETNIVSQSYYYNESKEVVISLSGATAVSFDGDPSGLDLYVETGWILSGSILLPEDGYFSGGQLYLSLYARDNDYNYYFGSGILGEAGGRYHIVVPKAANTYTVTLEKASIPSRFSSNVYIGEQTSDPVSVSGDTTGPSFTLDVAKTFITGTIFRPDGVSGIIRVNLYVDTETGKYSDYLYLFSSSNSIDFSIAIPEAEESSVYQLSYYISSTVDGILTGEFVYVAADGSLTTDYAQAGTFSFADQRSFSIPLLTVEPFAKGRIYCPEGLTKTVAVNVGYEVVSEASLLDRFDHEFTVYVGPGIGQQDQDGRWYSTYSLSDTSMTAGTTYDLVYCVDAPNDTVDSVYCHYVNPDGSIGNWPENQHTVPSSGSNVVDFTPLLWDDGSEDFLLQSPHGIDSSLGTVTYTYTFPEEVDTLTVRFSKRTDVELTINGQVYYAYNLAHGSAVTLNSNTLTITMTPTNIASYPVFGFAVTQITATSNGYPVGPAAAVYTETGSTDEAILSDLNNGQPVRVSLVSENISESTTTTLTGVIYDENGKMLELVQVPVDLTEGSDTATLLFEKYGTAATLKLLLTDGDWIPLMENLAYQDQQAE